MPIEIKFVSSDLAGIRDEVRRFMEGTGSAVIPTSAPTPVIPAEEINPPIPTDPTPVIPTSAPTSQEAEYDERGVPWNPEFHAGSKAMTGDGAWRKKRGVDAEAHETFEQQYLNTTISPVNVDTTYKVDENVSQSAEPEQQQHGTFQELVTRLNVLIHAGTIDVDYLQQLATEAGVQSFHEVIDNQDALNKAWEVFKNDHEQS